MSDAFHKPVRRPSEMFDRLFSAEDPAEVSRIAHSTAHALVARVRDAPDDEIVERLVAFTDDNGIDTIAELWSRSPAKTLPGTLWRIYLLQLMIHNDPAQSSLIFERGAISLSSVDPVVAGAPSPAGPDELVALADEILRGVFRGDLGVTLQRAAAFCRIQATGATHFADDYEATEPERASELTRRALRLSGYAADLDAAARLWNAQSLT
jgi:hypothetical protein